MPAYRRESLLRYLPWLLGPVLFLAAVLALHEPRSATPASGMMQADFLPDNSVRRTARKFKETTDTRPGVPPLYEVNREGLAISIQMDEGTWDQMMHVQARSGYKGRVTPIAIRMADRPTAAAMLSVRGGGSLEMPDKPAFRIKLLNPQAFAPDVEIETFYLVNLRFDPRQLKMRSSYTLLADLGLFPLHFQYVRVEINRKPLGMYLLVEQPTAAIRRTQPDCVAIFRRNGDNHFESEWTKAVPSTYSSISRFADLAPGGDDDAADRFADVCDVDSFLTWIAVNSVVRNSDTVDELFLYEVRTRREVPGRLSFVAWDYDDIFSGKPRTGFFEDPLMFSALADHERAVHDTPKLYARYRERLRALLDGPLSADAVVTRLEQTVRLRGSLDDGLAPDEQAKMNDLRERDLANLTRMVRERVAALKALLH